MKKIINCPECFFWDVFDKGKQKGFCRSHPPSKRVVVRGNDDEWEDWPFPVTSCDDWCGEAVEVLEEAPKCVISG